MPNNKPVILPPLHSVLDLIGEPIFVKDENFKFVIANKALCTILGMKESDILGKTLGESLPKDQMKHFLAVDKKVLDTGEQNISEEPLTGKGNKILTIITTKTRLIDENGNKFLIGVIHDITKKKEAEDALKEKNKQTEQMNASMVGREIKMSELKKEIDDLKKQLKK